MEGISNSSMAAVPSFVHHDCRFPAFANSFNPKPMSIGKRFLSHKSRREIPPFPVKLPSAFSRRAVVAGIGLADASTAARKLGLLVLEFRSLTDPLDRLKRLLHYAESLPPFDETLKTAGTRVPGCASQVWVRLELSADKKLRLSADSDSEITKGFCGCLVRFLDGATPEEVLSVKTEDLEGLNDAAGLNGRRANSWHNILMTIQKRTKALMAEAEGLPWIQPFPSLIVTADRIQAKGSYAEAQARFLLPDELKTAELVNLLREKKIGIVAHFYMDPEVQGVLTAAQKWWPHIHISDSLVMADSAVKMAESGCEFIAVLGVDFMSENVRAILDNAGFPEVSLCG
ncbi:hypothetical protein M569_02477 [Genlisea aurea]|uniref:Fe-S metabolism associated domain-containing protein n=1 Tax=Genlisea aurea TaxID=192259 RepID=S8D4I7_9LAMI|nr:hypothetical protein M569_02477 [Genlisea aurea]